MSDLAKTHHTAAIVRVERESPSFTPEAVSAIVKAVEGGLARSRAAALAGVSATTLAQWERLGLDGDTRYIELCDALATAEVTCENRLLKVLVDASVEDGDWKAAAWLLERRYPQTYGPQVKPAADDLSKLTDDEVERRLRELESK